MSGIKTQVVVPGPVIIGAGLAGLSCAIELAPAPCLVVAAGRIGTGTSTGWAQGGMAAAIGSDDSPELHAADTIAAGAGLCEEPVVRWITAAAPAAIEWLAALGAGWDRDQDGSWKRGLEGAHSRRRIVHASGDDTGAELLRATSKAARELASISIWERAYARRLVTSRGRVVGADVDTAEGTIRLLCSAVVLATGGIGGLFTHTTNPLSSYGQGMAMAYRAGAVLRDVELVQFHPTALNLDVDPLPLVSEAVRGEGAILVNELGERVLDNPLLARDVVARAEWTQLQAGHSVYLDVRDAPGARFAEIFPSIHAKACAAGLNPVTDLLPVTPAAHYHMGGVLVDPRGQSTVPGLFAIGEVASTGLHGANRLASNSLLEAVVCGRATAQYLRTIPLGSATGRTVGDRVFDESGSPDVDPRLTQIRQIVTARAGLLRNASGLRKALEELRPYLDHDAGLIGYLLVSGALERTESRGAHTRTDFPTTADPRHTVVSATLLKGRAA